MSALSLAETKGLGSRRLREHLSAPRLAGASDLRLLGLLRAMPKVLSSAVCSSQLQANAPEQQGEEGLHHTSRLRAPRSERQAAQATPSAVAAAKFPLAFRKSATRLFGCWARRRNEKLERCKPIESFWLRERWQLFSVIQGNSF